MGEVKQFMSIQKLPTILSKEGFPNVNLTYLGGLWVMMKFSSLITKEKFLHNVGVASWFNTLSNPQHDFVSKERIVWVDIEGVPLHLWSLATFSKIGSRWGEMLELEESKDDLFARKRLCIKTKQEDNILEKFKILIRGKAYTIRAKELFTWVPIFQEDIRSESFSDDESVHADERKEKHPESNNHVLDEDIDDDVVSGTYFEHDEKEEEQHESYQKNQTSKNPFHIYDILRKQDNEANSESDKTCSYPPGFTPKNEVNKKLEDKVSSPSDGFQSRVMADSQHIEDQISNLLALQETKLENFSVMDAKYIWGNSNFVFISSDSIGNSGGIVCMWESHVFKKDCHTVSDNFIAVYGTWMSTKSKILIITVYAPQYATETSSLWQYIAHLINHWKGDCIVMGDFNEVRSAKERLGSNFNVSGANDFNAFIANSGLIDLHLEGYSFTWSYPSAQKMSKLDRFLLSDGLLSTFLQISSICLDRHLSDHHPILLREIFIDFGATPFCIFHSWFSWEGFDKLLADIDKKLDCGEVNDELLLSRMNLMHSLQEKKIADARDNLQKAKVKWAVEGDENTKYFHGIINKNRANLSIRGVMVDGEWIVDPMRVKEAFKNHFASRFQHPSSGRCHINFSFPNRLSQEQQIDLESHISTDEIRKAVWDCSENKSPGPDGYTFEFYRKFWSLVGPDFCKAIQWFFEHSVFPRGCNSSFVALIPKVPDAKFVSDFRPISLISSMYKVVTKILANRLSSVNSDLVSDVQTAFISNRQILDGPFIINELLSWCKSKKKHAMVFKDDFVKAYDSVRWDFLDEFLASFGSALNESWIWVWLFITSLWLAVICKWSLLPSSMSNNDTLAKLQLRLSKWKSKTLSIGGRLTLLKAVLGASPIYAMSLYKVPKTVLKMMESIRSKFFNGVDGGEKKITWIKWSKVLAAKKNGGLGVSSFYALNRALLFKWAGNVSPWVSILRKVHSLNARGIDLVSHCKKRVGDGLNTSFWHDNWIDDLPLKQKFPRVYALESNKLCTVADKRLAIDLDLSFRHNIWGGVESQQYSQLHALIRSFIFSNSKDRWV
ncbi:RNA-directed DNA polymerase, eukaryota [Tanacetum coccineum]